MFELLCDSFCKSRLSNNLSIWSSGKVADLDSVVGEGDRRDCDPQPLFLHQFLTLE